MNELRMIIADNLTKLRKAYKLTQLELAEKLNYSDKAVSKWEHGDTMPDIETIKNLADLYNVTVDYILTEHNPLEKIDMSLEKKNCSNKIIITALSITLVWFIAIVVYAELQIMNKYNYWQAFIWAIPASFLVLMVFNAIWGKRKFMFSIITFFMWTLLLAFHLQFMDYRLWLIYLVGIPGQIAIILASQIKYKRTIK